MVARAGSPPAHAIDLFIQSRARVAASPASAVSAASAASAASRTARKPQAPQSNGVHDA